MPSEVTIESLLAGFVIETCLALILYGILIAQTYVYFLNSGKTDSPSVRALVLVLCILESCHTVFAIHLMYTYTILRFGDLAGVGRIVWSGGASVLTEMLIVSFVQGFYVRRVWIISKRWLPLTLVTGGLLVLRVAFGLATSALTYHLKTWASFRQEKSALFTLSFGLGVSALVDLLIASILIFYLHRGQSGFASTDGIVKAIMAYLVNTGAITMAVSLATVLTFVFLKSSLVFAGLVIMASKLYANSLLGTLNARQVLRNRSSVPASGQSGLPSSDVSTDFQFTLGSAHHRESHLGTKHTDSHLYPPASTTIRVQQASGSEDVLIAD